eukprot:TRINITY_DN29_c0_g2_i2.p1 TRINITY_DN29_c0_g2~~TRINITY_DN29_c0_g2_i2.p1  ORF type:complete len:266 (-),score=47.42 TRINITY_DN29_c0_g2_i2:247-1044(-)
MELSLMEQVMLLCLRKDGDVSSGPIGKKCPSIGITGAIVMELYFQNRIMMEKGEKGKVLFQLTPPPAGGDRDTPTTDDLLNDAIKIIAPLGKPLEFSEWIRYLCGTLIFHKGIENMEKRVYIRLCEKGILKQDLKKIIGLIESEKFPFENTEYIQQFTVHLHQSIENLKVDPSRISPKELCLAGLFHALDKPFVHRPGNALDINRLYPDKEERHRARETLEAVFNTKEEGDDVGLKGVSTQVTETILNRMLKVAVLGMFNILFNL